MGINEQLPQPDGTPPLNSPFNSAGRQQAKKGGTDPDAAPGCQANGGYMSETPCEKPLPPDKCPQVEIVPETDKEQHAHAMGDAELCEYITKALSPMKKVVRDNLAYIAEARNRFAQPGQRVPVAGRPTWKNWIKQNLGISDRHVRRLLAGERTPQTRQYRKLEPRVEVESAGIILGNKGLEMARKLRDGEVEAAKRIAAAMLNADIDAPDCLLPPAAPEHLKTSPSGPVQQQRQEESNDKAVAKLRSQIEGLKEFAKLAVEAFEIINGKFGERLMGKTDGNRLVEIAKKAAAMMAKVKVC